MALSKRYVTLNDLNLLLEWRNDEAVRNNSLNSQKIKSNEHFEWLIERLERVHLEPFWIFELEDEQVGIIRFERSKDIIDTFEVSIIINPKYRGIGFGTKILNDTTLEFSKNFTKLNLIARISKQNQISQRIFEKAGFGRTRCEENFNIYKYSI
jgi:RimJ/RimL family protein N-acetyltransferase